MAQPKKKGSKLLRAVERIARMEINYASGRPPICTGIYHQPKRPKRDT